MSLLSTLLFSIICIAVIARRALCRMKRRRLTKRIHEG